MLHSFSKKIAFNKNLDAKCFLRQPQTTEFILKTIHLCLGYIETAVFLQNDHGNKDEEKYSAPL